MLTDWKGYRSIVVDSVEARLNRQGDDIDYITEAMTASMRNRRDQMKTRCALVFITSIVFFSYGGLGFTLGWCATYIATLGLECLLFPRQRLAQRLSTPWGRRLAMLVVAVANIEFCAFGVMEASHGGRPFDGAVLFLGGATFNSFWTSARSSALTLSAAIPCMISMFLLPVAVYVADHSLLNAALYLVAVCAYLAMASQARFLIKSLLDSERAGREAAEMADAAKSRFIANTSHELRTPLNAVVASASLLARSPLSPRDRELVALLVSGSTTLQALISDVLDASKAEAGKIELVSEPFQPVATVRGVADLFRASAEAKGLALEFEGPPADEDDWLAGDALRLGQVVANLVNNAIKFTTTGFVRLCVAVAPAGDGRATLTISVADTGIGMDPATAARIFSPFVQADASTTRQFGGTGLGLSIAKALVEQMGGQMTVESRPGVGSTFRLSARLPVADAPAPRADHGAPDASRTIDRLRILVADDSAANRRLITLILEDIADVSAVENGGLALEALAADTFDLWICDIQMPIMDGPEAIKAFRRLELEQGRAHTPVILATADAAVGLAQAQALGADALLTKPFTAQSLWEAVCPWGREAPLADVA
jgi:signal transduction histidine kinase/ActR/RegA family two-component response regulator